MNGLLTRILGRPNKTRRPLLCVEQLENRDCPATLSLDAAVLAGHGVLLSGTVTGENVAGVVVTFSGAVSGSAVTNEFGQYSFLTNDASLGAVYAIGVDQEQQATNTAEDQIAIAAPTVSLSIIDVEENMVTLQGHVENIDEDALSVALGGVAGGSVECDPDGNFTLTVLASTLGDITAVTTDLWGQTSDTALVSLTSDGPLVYDFVAVHVEGNTWTFQGKVDDEDPEGLLVNFGGLSSLNGQSCYVQADGSFSFTCTLRAGETGTATAMTTDWWGQASNIAEAPLL